MDPPSAQLELEIHDSIVHSLAQRRPLLHHLNADSSWILQLPRPAKSTKRSGRAFYNILIDPWLFGGQSDGAKWFSQQWHSEPPAVGSIPAVEELCRELDTLASGAGSGGKGRVSNGHAEPAGKGFIDLVAISHEFTDHCHKETLLEVHPDVPVFATDVSASASMVSTLSIH
jgi:hypothetical protein